MTRRGARLVGVPGLDAMIKHHDILYRDLSDPAAFFRGETETELALSGLTSLAARWSRSRATYSDLWRKAKSWWPKTRLRADFSDVTTCWMWAVALARS